MIGEISYSDLLKNMAQKDKSLKMKYQRNEKYDYVIISILIGKKSERHLKQLFDQRDFDKKLRNHG